MPGPDVLDLMEGSALSFTATVVEAGAATTGTVPATERTAIVRVAEVLHAPAAFATLAGADITVRQADDVPALAAGQQVVLFTDPVMVGHGLAVREIARLHPADLAEAARSLAAEAAAPAAGSAAFRDLLAARRIRQHAEQADAIVLGQVTGLREARPPSPSEHDPHYWTATLAVRRVLRGSLPAGPADVLFMKSTDVRWHTAPKPRAGETAIWLLHAADGVERDLAPWLVVHPEDRQPQHAARLLGLEEGETAP
jgi:hypothetical protein